jgi:hypothetical protein
MANVVVFYRTSDVSADKRKPYFVTPQNCLHNFVKNFRYDELHIMADNVCDSTYEWLAYFPYKTLRRTKLGNKTSFKHALNLSVVLPDDTIAYFVENDYIHLPHSREILEEGIEIADYVSLYDHPDKYLPEHKDKVPTYLYHTKSTHWAKVGSTTMTFAAKVSTLKQDKWVFDAIIDESPYNHPNDAGIFSVLTGSRCNNRRLITPIHSYSTHGEVDWLATRIDWAKVCLDK